MQGLLTGKTTETYACAEGADPIATLVESILLNPKRKQRILDSKDPRAAIEQIKKYISVRPVGAGPEKSWMYMLYVPQFDVHFRVMATSRLAENVRYNPF